MVDVLPLQVVAAVDEVVKAATTEMLQHLDQNNGN